MITYGLAGFLPKAHGIDLAMMNSNGPLLRRYQCGNPLIKIDFKRLAGDYIWFGWIRFTGGWSRVGNHDLQWVIEKRNTSWRVLYIKD